MKSSYAIVLAAVLLGGVALQPAKAAGLLGGVSGALGGSGSTSGAGVQGVATASTASNNTGTRVSGTALGGGGSTINAGLGSVIGGNSNAALTLPGTGDSNLDTTLGDTAETVNGATDNGGTVGTLLGDTGLSGNDGGVGGAIGGNGGLLGSNDGNGDGGLPGVGNDNGTGLDGNGVGGGSYGAGGGAMTGLFGAAANSPACRQNTGTLAQLLRTPYSAGTAARWARANGIQLVKVPVCVQVKGALGRAVANSHNISRMQQMAEADPLISASLARSRVSVRHVLGIGQGKNGVTVYVY